MGWRDQNGAIESFTDNDPESGVKEEGPFTLTLVSVDNDNFTSTLEVMVDDITNGTSISCEIFRNQKHLVIYEIGS